MRIPIDLIAALLLVEHLGESLDNSAPQFRSGWSMALLWLGFLAGAWFFNEIAARLTERRTRFGMLPDGGGVGMHPQQFHTRCAWAAQFLTVCVFALVIWETKWPLFVERWPTWLGLDESAQVGNLELSRSMFVNVLLSVGPYLLSMVLAWIPRRRLASGSRRRKIPLWPYLAFEAKISWLPLTVLVVIMILGDVVQMLPHSATAWLSSDLAQLALLLGFSIFAAAILMPLAAVKLWKCEPLPDGELKERMRKLLARSGVKARAILVWGTRSSGMMNACVMGPWSRFRYVLISPLLADELSLDETEAVLGHELGHARYGHLTFYLALMLCMALLIVPMSTLVARGFRPQPLIQTGITMAFVISFIYFLFGSLSRQCEREADLASAELIGTPTPLIAALEKIALRNGNIRRVPCWHHGSIADRVTAVLRLSSDPGESCRFHARLKTLRWVLFGTTAALIAAQLLFRFDG